MATAEDPSSRKPAVPVRSLTILSTACVAGRLHPSTEQTIRLIGGCGMRCRVTAVSEQTDGGMHVDVTAAAEEECLRREISCAHELRKPPLSDATGFGGSGDESGAHAWILPDPETCSTTAPNWRSPPTRSTRSCLRRHLPRARRTPQRRTSTGAQASEPRPQLLHQRRSRGGSPASVTAATAGGHREDPRFPPMRRALKAVQSGAERNGRRT
jgi:hypothetical protein